MGLKRATTKVLVDLLSNKWPDSTVHGSMYPMDQKLELSGQFLLQKFGRVAPFRVSPCLRGPCKNDVAAIFLRPQVRSIIQSAHLITSRVVLDYDHTMTVIDERALMAVNSLEISENEARGGLIKMNRI